MVSGPTLACAASTAAVGSVAVRSANIVAERLPGGLAVTTISASSGTAASIARANGLPSETKTRPGVRSATIDFSLPKSLDISE